MQSSCFVNHFTICSFCILVIKQCSLFCKKKCKVVLAGELRDLRDYKIAKWAFKNLGNKSICHWNKIYSLVAEVALRMTGHQQLFRDQRKGKWCDTLLLARARILGGHVRARQNSAKIRTLAKSRVSHHFPFLWPRDHVWRQRCGGLRMRYWAAEIAQNHVFPLLRLFFVPNIQHQVRNSKI